VTRSARPGHGLLARPAGQDDPGPYRDHSRRPGAELRRAARPGAPAGRRAARPRHRARISTFADATDDHQWIHVDVERSQFGPFGATIAHGYLTLSLLIPLWNEMVELRGITMAVNYGLNKVRFPAPVPAGSKIRLGATLTAVIDVPGGVEALIDAVIETDASAKPVCVAQAVHRYYA
jgi:acyl dehydratase